MDKLKLRPERTASAVKTDVLRAAGFFCAGVLLSGARLMGVWIPASVCLIAALPSGSAALFTLLGAAAGSAAFWELETALVSVSAGFLALVAVWALRDSPLAGGKRFAPVTALCCGGVTAVLLLLSRGADARGAVALAVQLAVLFGGTVTAQRVLEKPAGVPLCLALSALISGCGGVPLPGGLPLGGAVAAGAVLLFSGSALALPMAALGGLALDWSRSAAPSAVPVLIAAALAASLTQNRFRKLPLFAAAAAGAVVLSGRQDGALFAAVCIGAALSLLAPKSLCAAVREPISEQLSCAASALTELYRQMDDLPAAEGIPTAALYDRAASQVCAKCARCAKCWKREDDSVRETFLDAAPAIRARGEALAADFPQSFSASCRHFPQLLAALNEGLSRDAAVRQAREGRRELRTVCRAQYRILADTLRRIAFPNGSEAPRYRAECAHRTLGCSGVSGDRAALLQAGNRLYLLLCDGMGAGGAASADSRDALGLLSRLLLAGCEPDDALELLNGHCILRERGGSAAIDLAALSLVSGEGVLYKWGGAPSYLQTKQGIKQFGTASLPPGVGVGGTHRPQQLRLSLGGGETLILLSDGVGGDEAAELLKRTEGESARVLAAELLSCGSAQWEDDRTAAVLRLHPTSTR